MDSDKETVNGVILTGRMISGAMIVGVAMFGVVVLILGDSVASQRSLGGLFLGILGLIAPAFLVVYAVLRAVMVRAAKSQCRQGGGMEMSLEALARVYAPLVIIRAAMAEGVGLAGLVFLLITGQKLLWAAPVMAIIILVAALPSRSRFDSFVQEVTGTNPYVG